MKLSFPGVSPFLISASVGILAVTTAIGCDGESDGNRAPDFTEFELEEPPEGEVCNARQVACASAVDRDGHTLEFVWEQTTQPPLAMDDPRVVSQVENPDQSITQCVEFVMYAPGIYDLRVTVFDLVEDENGNEVRVDDLRPADSRGELDFTVESQAVERSADALCVDISGTVSLFDDDVFSPSDSVVYPVQAVCIVSAEQAIDSLSLGTEPLCADEVFAEVAVECALQADGESVQVRVAGKLFEEESCPNDDLDGEAEMTVTVDPGDRADVVFRVDNQTEGGADFVDTDLSVRGSEP